MNSPRRMGIGRDVVHHHLASRQGPVRIRGAVMRMCPRTAGQIDAARLLRVGQMRSTDDCHSALPSSGSSWSSSVATVLCAFIIATTSAIVILVVVRGMLRWDGLARRAAIADVAGLIGIGYAGVIVIVISDRRRRGRGGCTKVVARNGRISVVIVMVLVLVLLFLVLLISLWFQIGRGRWGRVGRRGLLRFGRWGCRGMMIWLRLGLLGLGLLRLRWRHRSTILVHIARPWGHSARHHHHASSGWTSHHRHSTIHVGVWHHVWRRRRVLLLMHGHSSM
mmetsp:Transcript_6202/g.17343  ORF Transcript_6202/g.17343 Transcript_6202/m.17343 type:complete len:279 (+) Transcript_6202:740-1576(+)